MRAKTSKKSYKSLKYQQKEAVQFIVANWAAISCANLVFVL